MHNLEGVQLPLHGVRQFGEDLAEIVDRLKIRFGHSSVKVSDRVRRPINTHFHCAYLPQSFILDDLDDLVVDRLNLSVVVLSRVVEPKEQVMRETVLIAAHMLQEPALLQRPQRPHEGLHSLVPLLVANGQRPVLPREIVWLIVHCKVALGPLQGVCVGGVGGRGRAVIQVGTFGLL